MRSKCSQNAPRTSKKERREKGREKRELSHAPGVILRDFGVLLDAPVGGGIVHTVRFVIMETYFTANGPDYRSLAFLLHGLAFLSVPYFHGLAFLNVP